MLQERVETVRAVYARWSEGDFHTHADLSGTPAGRKVVHIGSFRDRADAFEAAGLTD